MQFPSDFFLFTLFFPLPAFFFFLEKMTTKNNDNLLVVTSSDSIIHSLTNADTCNDKTSSTYSDPTTASIWLKRASRVLSTATNDTEESEPAVQQELMEVTQLLTEAPVVMESAASLLLLTSNNSNSPQQEEEDDDVTRRKRTRQELLPNNTNDFQLRRGKWTSEEEAYVLCLVRDFNDGYLDVVVPGMTLRTYLAQALRCDPMRITKKFTGDLSIGKRTYHPSKDNSPQDRQARREELQRLKDAWNQRMILQEQEAAAALLAKQHQPEHSILSNNGLDEIKLTAEWLDRATTVLLDTWNNRHSPLSSSSLDSSSDSWCLTNLKQIQQLLMEAKDVQETCAKLPQLIESASKKKKT